MIIIFNLVIIGMVGLIAYWWANEGLFSAFLHLVCVITAGTIALSLWEPISMAMLKGGSFDNYIWGVSLIGVFVVSLLLLRFATDKLVPSNVQLPTWVNMGFGGAVGACAGVLSMGFCIIGSGFLQSSNEFLSYRGVGRNENNRAKVEPVGDPLWLDVPKLTAQFFSMLSVGSFHPDFGGAPLKHFNPKINELATLVRDSYDGGNGQLSLMPNAAKVTKVAMSSDGLIVIMVSFTTKAKDYGSQLILSSSQVRLIGEATGTDAPDIYYPMGWKQEVNEIGEVLFRFDDNTHYATSVPGRQDTGIKFSFDTKDSSFKPRFIQIRGTRFPLPTTKPTVLSATDAQYYRGRKISNEEIRANRDPLGKDIQHLIDITSRIRRLRISTNGIPGTIELDEDHYLIEGTLTTQWTQQGVSSALAIKGIRADKGTVIVHVDITPGGNAAFEDLLPIISEDSPVILLDTEGRRYAPIGFYIDDGKRIQLTLIPSSPIRTIGELPMHVLTSSKSKGMTLIFQVTEGQWLKELRVGDITIGTCNIEAKSSRR